MGARGCQPIFPKKQTLRQSLHAITFLCAWERVGSPTGRVEVNLSVNSVKTPKCHWMKCPSNSRLLSALPGQVLGEPDPLWCYRWVQRCWGKLYPLGSRGLVQPRGSSWDLRWEGAAEHRVEACGFSLRVVWRVRELGLVWEAANPVLESWECLPQNKAHSFC